MSNFNTPLGELAYHVSQVGTVFGELADVLVAGGEDQGYAAVHGVVQEADAVGQPGFNVEIDQGRAVAGHGIPVGHAHSHALLGGKHVAEVGVFGHQGHDGAFAGAGVAENDLYALGAQHLEEGAGAGHLCHCPAS